MNLAFDFTRHHFAFGIDDSVTIDGTRWRPISSNEVGWVMTQPEGTGLSHQFTHAELSSLGASKRILTERDYFSAEAADRRLKNHDQLISLLTTTQQAKMSDRKQWVDAFQMLERECKINRTDRQIIANKDALTIAALKCAQLRMGMSRSHASAGITFKKCPSPRSLRKWLKAFETDGLAGLADQSHKRGNRNPVLLHHERALLMKVVRGYMAPEKPTIVKIVNRVRDEFGARNAERAASGLPNLKTPSRETVRRAVRSLDPYQVYLRRYGAAAARKKFAPVGKGLQLTRPLERVEIDEWDIDLISILADAGLLDWFSEEERKALGLTGKKVRWKLTVAICTTTRCILAMVMTPKATASAAIQALKMVLSDKGALTTAVKAHGNWHMHGLPELVVTDCGSAFTSQEFQIACADIGVAAQRSIAGLPELRARIERVFRTMGVNLLPELAGRTFSNIIEKGDANPAERACLTENDLAFVFIRWVVDIYHNMEHDGLGGETPAQCWERLTAEFGVTPPPDVQTCRQVFGQKINRKVGKKGVRVLGVQYHSPTLAHYFLHRQDRDLELRWLPSDIGAIELRLDKQWITVPAVMDNLHGVSAQLWSTAVREVRAADPDRKRHDEAIMLAALRDIRERTQDAQAAMGLLVDDWSDDRLRKEEQKLMIGFEVSPARTAAPRDGGFGRSLLPEPPDDPIGATPTPTEPRSTRTRKYKLGE